jgi:CRP/FNR family transcriptional regulator
VADVAPTDLVKSVPLFSDLNRKQLDQVSRCFKQRIFAPGDTIAREGQSGVGFFLIEDGHASVSVKGEERGTISAGDYFGEVALIDDGSRSATVTAVTELRCWGMTPWDFRPLVESDAGIAWKLLQVLAKRLRAAEQRAAS